MALTWADVCGAQVANRVSLHAAYAQLAVGVIAPADNAAGVAQQRAGVVLPGGNRSSSGPCGGAMANSLKN